MSKKQVTSGTKAKKTIVNIIIHIFGFTHDGAEVPPLCNI